MTPVAGEEDRKRPLTPGQPVGKKDKKLIFPVLRGEHINFLVRLTGRPGVQGPAGP